MKKTSGFSPEQQLTSLDARLLLSLQRLSDMLKAIQWEQARILGITPLQLQILLFTGHHTAAVNKVAYIAMELQLSRPTVSDAAAALVSKGLLRIEDDLRDRRSYSFLLTDNGLEVLEQAEKYTADLYAIVGKRPLREKMNLYQSVFTIVAGLSNDKGGMQRTCYNCAHYEGNKKRQHGCGLLQKKLASAELQIDCMYHSTLS
ncbi:MarR family transcriptional regulator [Chitinophaga filiformis]|uniref:MarR family transcriptional regulator n=1 Tax=Chitinophaga filiformis TaxID=104663 RepID=A0ABY4IC73_CHIFI|nr:MarR family transcriptional regulator [Chitinophaga filiformis]UPK72401.1 MarR family transcriptional regulator [Chitinophaga filiformis]